MNGKPAGMMANSHWNAINRGRVSSKKKKVMNFQWGVGTRILYKDNTFEIEARPDILDYIFAPLVPFNKNYHR